MIRLEVEGIGKAYKLYDRPVDSLKEALLRRQYHRKIWALRDVSFELGDGESFGVIGENGAGKTTLFDRPVKIYSSGMYVRLAFSVATSVEPDILVIDEALAVGDLHFQKKYRMISFGERGKTIVFCSHGLYFVRKVTERCLWLKEGRPAILGETGEVIEKYQDSVREQDGVADLGTAGDPAESRGFVQSRNRLADVALGGDCEDGAIRTGQTLTVRISASLEPELDGEAHVGLLVHRNDGLRVYAVSTEMEGERLHPLGGSEYGVELTVPDLPLLAGEYSIDVALTDAAGLHIYDRRKAAQEFRVRQETSELGLLRLRHEWRKP